MVIGRGNSKYLEKNMPHYHFIHHSKDYPGI